jgi:hypothetical protein
MTQPCENRAIVGRIDRKIAGIVDRCHGSAFALRLSAEGPVSLLDRRIG